MDNILIFTGKNKPERKKARQTGASRPDNDNINRKKQTGQLRAARKAFIFSFQRPVPELITIFADGER